MSHLNPFIHSFIVIKQPLHWHVSPPTAIQEKLVKMRMISHRFNVFAQCVATRHFGCIQSCSVPTPPIPNTQFKCINQTKFRPVNAEMKNRRKTTACTQERKGKGKGKGRKEEQRSRGEGGRLFFFTRKRELPFRSGQK